MSKSQLQFIAHPWLKNNHLQTVIANLLPAQKKLSFDHTFLIKLHDGDQLALNYINPRSKKSDKTLWIIGHGLSGDSSAPYIHRIARELHRLHHPLIIIDHRNCGTGKGLAKNPYHSGRSEDLQAIVEWTRKNFPQNKIGVLGFSMSGNILLKNLIEAAETPTHAKPDFAIAVNPPIHLKATSEAFSQGFNQVYDKYFVFRIVNAMKETKQIPDIKNWKRLLDLDNDHTAPTSGYKDAEEMYLKSSTFNRLQYIDIPTWILTSSDDPFVPVKFFPDLKSASVKVHITEGGGHMGYLHKDKTPLGNYFWMDYAIIEKIKEFQNFNFPQQTRANKKTMTASQMSVKVAPL